MATYFFEEARVVTSTLSAGFYIVVDGTLCLREDTLKSAQKTMYDVLRILPKKAVYICEVLPREVATYEAHRVL